MLRFFESQKNKKKKNRKRKQKDKTEKSLHGSAHTRAGVCGVPSAPTS
jgi:hypothetical protein